MPHEHKAIERSFYDRDPKEVARGLLGTILVRRIGKVCLAGKIVETEAYLPENDPACHSFRGQTKRNASMYADAGHAYVYTMHRQHLFNIVTEGPERPGAVLIRALEPLHGLETMMEHRNAKRPVDLTNGPGKFCAALHITKAQDGSDITDQENEVYITRMQVGAHFKIGISSRVGLSKARELPLRFFIINNRFVSRPRNGT